MATYGDGGFYFLQPVGSGYSGVDSMLQPSRRGYGADMSRTRSDASGTSTTNQGMSRTRADSSVLAFTALEPQLVNIPLTKGDLERIHTAYSRVYKSFPKKEVGGFTPKDAEKRLKTMHFYAKTFGKNYVFGDLPYVVRGREYMGQWIKQNILDAKGYSGGYGDGGFYFLQPVGSGYSGIEYGADMSRTRSDATTNQGMGRTKVESERIDTNAAKKILTYWTKSRAPTYAAEVKRINDNSKGDCEQRHKAVTKGAVTGAAIGTAIPVPGVATAVGAGIGAAAGRLSWSKDNCSDTRYANYKKALANYAAAVAVTTTLTQWVASKKAHTYSELPNFLRSDATAVAWIKANVLGKATKGLPTTAGQTTVRGSFKASGAATPATDSTVTEAVVTPEMTEVATVSGSLAPSEETVTAMGARAVAAPEAQMMMQAQSDLTSAAVATVDSAVAKQESEGFLASTTGKVVLGVAAVGAIGGLFYFLGKR